MKRNLSLSLMSLLLIGLGMTMSSCAKGNSSDVNQDKIYTIYDVFYNKNSDKTWVTARFQFGGATGTNLQLDSTSYVMFNSDTLPYNWLFACHFKEYAGRITTGTFKYENQNGQVFSNSVPTPDTLAFQPGFTTLHKNSANTITWNGSALAPNEAVSLFVGTWVWGQDALGYQDGDGATNIILGTNQMNNTALGSATVYMDRKKQVNVTQGTSVGGTISATFRATNTTVQVVN